MGCPGFGEVERNRTKRSVICRDPGFVRFSVTASSPISALTFVPSAATYSCGVNFAGAAERTADVRTTAAAIRIVFRMFFSPSATYGFFSPRMRADRRTTWFVGERLSVSSVSLWFDFNHRDTEITEMTRRLIL